MLFVTGCATNERPQIEVQTQIVTPDVPRSNLVCPAIPTPPDPDTATQRDVAVYIVELTEVAEHCKRDLAVVRAILDRAAQMAADGTITSAEMDQLEAILNDSSRS